MRIASSFSKTSTTIGVVLVALVGCGASARQVTGPDGSPSWYEITCSGDHGGCLDKARDLCPNGYEAATSDGRTQRVVSDALVGAPESGHLTVRCR